MSGLEILAVVSCVAAVCSAYHDGTELIHQIKERRKAKKALREAVSPDSTTKDLELSLARGQDVVRSQYDRDFRRLGQAFALGDQEARDTLKDIIIHLQGQVISNLKIAWQQDAQVDFLPLQDVSDDSQDRAIYCLMQLHQRLLIAAPITDINTKPARPIKGFKQGFIEPISRESTWASQSGRSPTALSQSSSLPTQSRRISDGPPRKPFPPHEPYEPSTSRQRSTRPDSPPEPASPLMNVTNGPDKRKSGRLGPLFRKPKSHGETTAHILEDPSARAGSFQMLTPPYDSLTDGRMFAGLGLGTLPASRPDLDTARINSVSTGSSIELEPDNPAFNPWSDTTGGPPPLPKDNQESYLSTYSQRSALVPDALVVRKDAQGSSGSKNAPLWQGQRDSHHTSRSSQYSQHSSNSNTMSIPRISEASSTPRSISEDTMQTKSPAVTGELPREDNNYAGFCKGAWRLQIGDKKKALNERQRPGGIYVTMAPYWRCSKCSFEGRLIKDAKGKSSTDPRIWGAHGILYRWEFLFKSHVHLKDRLSNPLNATFGCIFCCAEGNGTPIIGGVQNFMAHLQEHKIRPPTGEVLYRIKCVVGRQPKVDEDFDVALTA